MKDYPVSTRYSAAELRQLDRTANALGIPRSELIRARSLGKILTLHELARWAEAEIARNAKQKARRARRAA